MAIDQSTPDRALKSFWQIADRQREWRSSQRSTASTVADESNFEQLTSGELKTALTRKPTHDSFAREIVEVKVESPSRATIIATVRNISPLEHGATETARDLQLRQYGERYRYVLELIGERWTVAQIQQFREYRSPPAWESMFDNRPQVPTYTSPM